MTQALIIGEAQRRQIAALQTLAAANVMDPIAMQRNADANMAAHRDMMAALTIVLPVGYHVCYSQETQPEAGLCHHISISVERRGKMPSVEAVEMVLKEFGMVPLQQSDGVWVEDVSPTLHAVNVVQRVT